MPCRRHLLVPKKWVCKKPKWSNAGTACRQRMLSIGKQKQLNPHPQNGNGPKPKKSHWMTWYWQWQWPWVSSKYQNWCSKVPLQQKDRKNQTSFVSDSQTVTSQVTSMSQLMERVSVVQPENKTIMLHFDQLTGQKAELLSAQKTPTTQCPAGGHRSESSQQTWWLYTAGLGVRFTPTDIALLI